MVASHSLREHHARVDSVRAESAAGVKERATRAFWTAFALSSGQRGENPRALNSGGPSGGTESLT
jgi:hypothetical protein